MSCEFYLALVQIAHRPRDCTPFTMDYLQSADPVAIAREHIPIVDALDSGHAELAAALLASHSNRLVEFLRREPPLRRDARAVPVEGAAR